MEEARAVRFLRTSPKKAKGGQGMNAGDVAFILVASALVMLMTPGLALF
jgi:Amt family ammonium transporter